MMRRMFLQLPLVAINNTMHGAATVIFYEVMFQ